MIAKRPATAMGIPAHLKAYHMDAYPEDGEWDDWYYSFAAMQSTDQYVLLVKYRRRPGWGDLYSKRVFDAVELFPLDVFRLLELMRDTFDHMRVEIIECLDGLIKPEPKPKENYWKSMTPAKYHITMTDMEKAMAKAHMEEVSNISSISDYQRGPAPF